MFIPGEKSTESSVSLQPGGKFCHVMKYSRNVNSYSMCLFNHMTWTAAQVIITIQVQTNAKGSTQYSSGISTMHYITLYIVNQKNN